MSKHRTLFHQNLFFDQKHILGVFLGLSSFLVYAKTALAQFGQGIQPIVENEYTENVTNGTTSLTTLETIISNLLGLGTVIGSIIFIGYFLLGAISWIGAGGDSGKIGKARDQMIQGVIGLIVLVALYALIGLVGSIVGLNILNPAQVLEGLIPSTGP